MKVILFLSLCLFSAQLLASKKAVTEDGDVVILNDDGTWTYEDGSANNDSEIPTNPTPFFNDDNSNFALKSNKTNATFSINPKKWKFKKNDNGHESAEYTFELKEGDLYGMAITEAIEMKVEVLADVAFNNAKAVAPDAKLINKEYRTVNGNKAVYMEFIGTIQSIRFKYFGYYYSNSSGSTQYLAYTSANLENRYTSEIETFLNGFGVQP